MNHRFKLILVTFTFVALAGCGYRFSQGSGLPDNIKRIYITIFENRTSEIGIENVLAAEVIETFTNVHQAELAPNRQNADAALTGTVTYVQIYTISRIGQSISDERRIQITVDATLTDSQGRTIRQVRGITDGEAYSVDPDNNQATLANKREAIAKVAEKLSELIYNRLSDNF